MVDCKGIQKGPKRLKMDINELVDKYPLVTNEPSGMIKFCPVEMCKINIPIGEKVCKRGTIIPQGLRIKVREYSDEMIRRSIL